MTHRFFLLADIVRFCLLNNIIYLGYTGRVALEEPVDTMVSYIILCVGLQRLTLFIDQCEYCGFSQFVDAITETYCTAYVTYLRIYLLDSYAYNYAINYILVVYCLCLGF